MSRRKPRFTQVEMVRLLKAIDQAGISAIIEVTDDAVRIVPNAEKLKAEPLPRGLRIVEGKDIIL